MSILLLDNEELYRTLILPKHATVDKKLNLTKNGEINRLFQYLQNETKKIREVYSPIKRQNAQFYQWHFKTASIRDKYSTLLTLKIHKHKRTLQMKLTFLSENNYFTVQNRNRYIQIAHQNKIRFQRPNGKSINLFLSMVNGQLIAQFPIIHIFNDFFDHSHMREQPKLFKIYLDQIQHSLPLLEKLLSSNGESSYSFIDTKHKQGVWEKNFRYYEMMNIASHLDESCIETQSQFRENDKRKKSDIKKYIKYHKSIDDWIITNNSLFQEYILINRLVPQNQKQFHLSHEEVKYIRTVIAMPLQPKTKFANENNMIQNHIFIKNVENAPYSKINQGGFSEIYISQIDYQYVYSSDGYEALYQQSSLANSSNLHKYVVVKKGKTVQEEQRIFHEIQILKCIKNGLTIFLPKYYISVNKNCFFTDSVIMDFIPFKNLKEYLKSNEITISMTTKIYLIYSITQSLRYIRDYRIVHLDLKPNNIMIFCNLLIKLIDFGESYHPDVSEQKHRPGHTIPYSSPEVYYQKYYHYTSKSDIFSLGVIIYQILYRVTPFQDRETTEKNDDLMDSYTSQWFFPPQELQNYGDSKILRLLNIIISKCLSPLAADRPELDWIAVILRQCFDLLN